MPFLFLEDLQTTACTFIQIYLNQIFKPQRKRRRHSLCHLSEVIPVLHSQQLAQILATTTPSSEALSRLRKYSKETGLQLHSSG